MFNKRRVITAFLLCLAIPAAARGQADPCQQRFVAVSVLDEQGKPVQGLAARDFSAQIKRKPVNILSAQLDAQPHRVVVVLDSSGSMTEPQAKWSMAKSLASDALAASPARFRAGFIVFNDKIRVRLPIQEDTQPARDALNALVTPQRKSDKTTGGLTALLDALMGAIQMLDPRQFGDSIYVITDADDNRSVATPKEVRAALACRGIRLFAEWFGEIASQRATPEEVSGQQDLFDLVENSGGFALSVPASPHPGGEYPTSYKLNPKEEKHFQSARLYLYSLIQFAYRLEIALPAPTKKVEKWNLTVPPPKNLHARWLITYPKRLDSCADAASAAR